MIYLLFVGLQQFRGNLMSNLGLYYTLPAKLTCVTVRRPSYVHFINVIYFVLYHDCSDLSHVLVFTITWQKKKPGDIMV